MSRFMKNAKVLLLPACALLIASCTGPVSSPAVGGKGSDTTTTNPGGDNEKGPDITIPPGMSIQGSPVNVDAVGDVQLAAENFAALNMGLAYDYEPAPSNPDPNTGLYYKVAFDNNPLDYYGYGVRQKNGASDPYVYREYLHDKSTLTIKNQQTDQPFSDVQFENGLAYVSFSEATCDIAVTTSAHYLKRLFWGAPVPAAQDTKQYQGQDDQTYSASAPAKSGVYTSLPNQDSLYPVVLGYYQPMKKVSFKVKVTDLKNEPIMFLNARNFKITLPNFSTSLVKVAQPDAQGVYSVSCMLPADALGPNYLSYGRRLTVAVGDRPGDIPLP
ncbi:hypothetical protein J7643_02100 [bacterium]|nr:hypothetical protein [bacterium]